MNQHFNLLPLIFFMDLDYRQPGDTKSQAT